MIVCAGAAMIDCIVTRLNDDEVVEDISLHAGGEAFNESSVLGMLGDRVFLSAAIGDDEAGRILREEAGKYGIELAGGAFSGRTPVTVLQADSTGNRKSTISKAHALPGFVPALPAEKHIDFVTMGSLFRAPFLDPGICAEFALKAKKTGARILADTKLPKGTSPKLKDYADTLELLDFITPNSDEAFYYTGRKDPAEAAKIFHSAGVKNVVIKMSDKGSFISPSDSEAFYLPAFKVNVADGIGAGDTYAAALIHSLIKGYDIRRAGLFAAAASAVNVTRRGAAGSVRSESEVLELLARNGVDLDRA